jgi:hypothetical protein
MPPKSKSSTPSSKKKFTFVPPIKKGLKLLSDKSNKIKEIVLPGIVSSIPKIDNFKPDPVTETAVVMPYTREQITLSSIDGIDISRISGKRSGGKNSGNNLYKVEKLRLIARHFGINGNKMNKEDLANAILKKFKQLRSEEPATGGE